VIDLARTRFLAVAGLGGVALAAVLVGLLHVLASEVDPVRWTISEYALGDFRPLFDVGVLGLAAGSLLVLAASVRAGLLRALSAPAVLIAVWAVALVVVVAFEKTNWSVGQSLSGYIHRYASLVAFASLPAAAIAVGRRWRGDPDWGRFAVWSRWSGALALVVLAALVGAVALRITTGMPVWQYMPLGLTERVLALFEVAAVAVLGTWAYRAVAPARAAAASAPVPVG
jgi:Protein of unknown function (DUF998)